MTILSKAALMRDIIEQKDLPHRKGWRLSEFKDKKPTLKSLLDEVKELKDALKTNDLDNAREEIGDVFVCVLEIARRLGMTFEDLDNMAVYKMSIRFDGADEIVL